MLPRLLKPDQREPQMSPIPRDQSQVEQPAESRYQALLDADSTGVYTCDAAGVITFYNKQAAELWGRSPEVGDTDEKFYGSHMMYRVDGSYLPHDQCPMAEALAGKVSGVHDAEVQVQRPPLVDDTGAIVGAVNSFCENPLRKRLNGAPELLSK